MVRNQTLFDAELHTRADDTNSHLIMNFVACYIISNHAAMVYNNNNVLRLFLISHYKFLV